MTSGGYMPTITVTRPELNTTKIEGFAVTDTNTTSEYVVTKRELSDLYWVTSEMKIKSTGGNEKKVCLLDAVNTKFINPDTGAVTPYSNIDTFMATKMYAADANVARLTTYPGADPMYVTLSRHDGSNPIDTVVDTSNDVQILDVAYYNNGRSGLSSAVLYMDGADLMIALGNKTSQQIQGVAPIDYKVYCNKDYVAVILVEASQVIVERYTYSTTPVVTTTTFATSTYTYCKVMDPFSTIPTLVGYKTDGVYTIVNSVETKVVSLSGITGMAVNFVGGSKYSSDWIYRQSDGVCRNKLGKRVAGITGEMNLGYNFQTHIISDSIEIISE